MKKKFTVMIIAFAMIIGTTGVSFAGTKGAINLKLHFADLYKIFNFIHLNLLKRIRFYISITLKYKNILIKIVKIV